MYWLVGPALAAGFEDPALVDPDETQRVAASLATAAPSERPALERELEVRLQLSGRRMLLAGGGWVSLPGGVETEGEVPVSEWDDWHLGPESELWLIEPHAGPARRVTTFRLVRSRYGECGGFEGVVLDVGPHRPGSLLHVGPPPASWHSPNGEDAPSAADLAWRASVDRRVAQIVGTLGPVEAEGQLGPVEVTTLYAGRTAFARVVQRQQRPEEVAWGYDELVTELVYVRGAAPRVRHTTASGYALDERPVWLFDADDDGALDVISTLCEANVHALDGRVLVRGHNPCCGC